jgi:hypothetical protein
MRFPLPLLIGRTPIGVWFSGPEQNLSDIFGSLSPDSQTRLADFSVRFAIFLRAGCILRACGTLEFGWFQIRDPLERAVA